MKMWSGRGGQIGGARWPNWGKGDRGLLWPSVWKNFFRSGQILQFTHDLFQFYKAFATKKFVFWENDSLSWNPCVLGVHSPNQLPKASWLGNLTKCRATSVAKKHCTWKKIKMGENMLKIRIWGAREWEDKMPLPLLAFRCALMCSALWTCGGHLIENTPKHDTGHGLTDLMLSGWSNLACAIQCTYLGFCNSVFCNSVFCNFCWLRYRTFSVVHKVHVFCRA